MATRDLSGRVTETPREATQAKNSKNSFVILTVSMFGLVVIGLALFWYFGELLGTVHLTPVLPR